MIARKWPSARRYLAHEVYGIAESDRRCPPHGVVIPPLPPSDSDRIDQLESKLAGCQQEIAALRREIREFYRIREADLRDIGLALRQIGGAP